MADIAFNINQHVKVKINERGFEYWKQQDDAILPVQHQKAIEHYRNKADRDGYVKMQMHHLMNIFGDICSISQFDNNIFDPNIIVCT